MKWQRLLQFSPGTCRVNVELKSQSFRDLFCLHHQGRCGEWPMSLIFIPVRQIYASSYWCTMQQEGGVKLYGHPSDSDLSPCCLTWRRCCQTTLFSACSSVCLLGIFVMYVNIDSPKKDLAHLLARESFISYKKIKYYKMERIFLILLFYLGLLIFFSGSVLCISVKHAISRSNKGTWYVE
jgi:hypothetical protein